MKSTHSFICLFIHTFRMLWASGVFFIMYWMPATPCEPDRYDQDYLCYTIFRVERSHHTSLATFWEAPNIIIYACYSIPECQYVVLLVFYNKAKTYIWQGGNPYRFSKSLTFKLYCCCHFSNLQDISVESQDSREHRLVWIVHTMSFKAGTAL